MGIVSLLSETIAVGASDLHLAAGHPPLVRVDGVLRPLNATELTPSSVDVLAREVVPAGRWKTFLDAQELDFGFEEGEHRYRVNAHIERGNVAVAIRVIPLAIPTIADLGIPENVVALSHAQNGIVLVTGQSGAGKSTTIASLLEDINQNESVHILTLEDPIEFVFPRAKGLVKQREVGTDTHSFADGLRHALRQDPDIIMVGEMRDPETMAAALTLAETGHLVFSTLHTNDAAQSMHRIVDAFPAHQQDQIRSQLALTLRGVVAQALLPGVNGGRVMAREILINNAACANLIRENKPEQIPTVIQTGKAEGMVSMAQSVEALLKAKLISPETARPYLPVKTRSR